MNRITITTDHKDGMEVKKIQLFSLGKAGGNITTDSAQKLKMYLSRLARKLAKDPSDKTFPMVFRVIYNPSGFNEKKDCMSIEDINWCIESFIQNI